MTDPGRPLYRNYASGGRRLHSCGGFAAATASAEASDGSARWPASVLVESAARDFAQRPSLGPDLAGGPDLAVGPDLAGHISAVAE
jgi:hypothetical protein